MKMSSMRSRILATLVFLITLENILLKVRCEPDRYCLDNGDNYPTNGQYHSNLNNTFASLSANMTANGYLSVSSGQTPNTVYAFALCRGDIQLDACRRCVQNLTIEVINYCPGTRQAIIWEANLVCMLRYSNVPIAGHMSTTPGRQPESDLNVTSSPVQFMADLRILLDGLRTSAAYGGNSSHKVAGGTLTSANVTTIFGLVQCTPDLSPNDCNSCLANATDVLPRCCNWRIGARILMPSCFIRYEITTFFEQTSLPQLAPLDMPPPPPTPSVPTPPPPPTPPPSPPGNHIVIVIIVVAVVASAMLAAFAALLVRRRMKKRLEREDECEVDILQHDFEKIRVATNDFAEANKLGQGGFGSVYKGKLLNGQEIAVKRLSSNSCQGDLEFKNEVKLLAKLQHRNLVRLIGFSQIRTEKLLVYEFLQNSSLERFIFDPNRRLDLTWDKRYNIIRGIAKGILYLHDDSPLKIIHRDLKASNILLDDDMNPKIADFGTARLFALNETQANTSKIIGTFGYMPPEYVLHGQFSIKSDVYSFGVLTLEVISGQKVNSFQDSENGVDLLTRVAWKSLPEGANSKVIDSVLRGNLDTSQEVLRCIHIGLLCVQQNATERPTMASIVQMLNSCTTLPVPSQPAFFGADLEDSTYTWG